MKCCKLSVMSNSNFYKNGKMPIHVQEQSSYERLDPTTNEWISQLKTNWSAWRRSALVSSFLCDFFLNSENPYEVALKAMVNSGDFYQSRPSSLSHYVMEYFSYWKSLYSYKLKPLTTNLKLDAFNVVTKQKYAALTKLVVEIFEMKADKSLFLDSIHAMAQRKMYKEACQVAVMLELYDDIRIEEFVIPLIFQDKFTVAQEFLNGSQHLQMQTAQYLDGILGEKHVRFEAEKRARELDVFDLRMDKMCGKPLSKLLKRIIRLYNIPTEMCPNLTRKKGSGALQFLLRKRFLEKTIGTESWSEMVEEAVGDDPDLQLELVTGVAIFGDKAEAIIWADKYNIPDSQRPYEIQSGRIHTDGQSSENDVEEKWDLDEPETSGNFHKMKLPESQIRLIDTAEAFNDFLEYNLSDVFICGIDCEWKPSMGWQKCELALMQIATFENVYIIDISTLMTLVSEDLWGHYVDKLFMNNEILKIGFGFDGDFSVMQDTLPCFRGLKPTGSGYLDLLPLWRILVNNYNFEFPFTGASGSSAYSESLSRLVQLTLGGKLDKSDQFSNWERRPLRNSQIIYAALDAYCLLEVYEVLKTKAEAQNIPFLDIVAGYMGGEETEKKTLKNKNKQRLP